MRTFHNWSGVKLIAENDEDVDLLKKLWDRIPDEDKDRDNRDIGWTLDLAPTHPSKKAVLSISTD
jgi:hypothetical protein